MINPNPNELRRGNYILYLNELYVVTGLKEEGKERRIRVFFSSIDGQFHNAKTINWIESIRLTPEIFEQLGFKDQTGGWGGSQGADYSYKKSGIEIRNVDFDDEWHLSDFLKIKFKYVHQLQNIYFDFEGKELTLKL